MPDEDPQERVNRELIELLNELRVALPGVQVLFAFLLTLPFAQRFSTLDAGDRRIYLFAVIATAIASAFLIAPSAHHRARFRKGTKEQILKLSNVFALVGMLFLALAMALSMYVVTQALYEPSVATTVAVVVGGGTTLLWFVAPILYRTDEVTRYPPGEPRE